MASSLPGVRAGCAHLGLAVSVLFSASSRQAGETGANVPGCTLWRCRRGGFSGKRLYCGIDLAPSHVLPALLYGLFRISRLNALGLVALCFCVNRKQRPHCWMLSPHLSPAFTVRCMQGTESLCLGNVLLTFHDTLPYPAFLLPYLSSSHALSITFLSAWSMQYSILLYARRAKSHTCLSLLSRLECLLVQSWVVSIRKKAFSVSAC